MEVEVFEIIRAINRLIDNVTSLTKKFDDLANAPVFAPGPEYLNEVQACDFLFISKRTLATLRKKGKIPYIKTNRKILFRLSDLQQFLDSYTIHC